MKYRKDGDLHLVRLDAGDKIRENLRQYVIEQDIHSGFLTGIGATSDATIAWYDTETCEYLQTEIHELCEITSLVGNIGWVGNEPMIHAHITLGKRDYSIIGGHLVDGTIGVTGEIWICTSPFKVMRTSSEQFKNLKLIDFEAG